ncbi:hypothetical protein D9M68_20130 [compost metagenome]
MQKLILPIAEVVSYVRDVTGELPPGHGLPKEGKARTEMIVNAVATFVTGYIRVNLRYLRKKPDPMADFLLALGYQDELTSEGSTVVDELCVELDEMFLDLAVICDVMTVPLMDIVGSKKVDIYHDPLTEELVIELGEDIVLARYKELLARTRQIQPLRRVRELADLDDVEEHINHVVSEVFNSSGSVAVRDEIKRLFIDSINRH